MFDVAIIGAGITGCAIARELSRYRGSFVVVEKGVDVAMGASRANSAIVHAGYDCKPGTNMARVNVEGNRRMTDLCRELDVPLDRTGSLVLAFSDEEMGVVRELYEQGIANGVPEMKILNREETLQIEPGLNPEVVGSLYAGTGGITCPYQLTIACAENAAHNGVEFVFDHELTNVTKSEDGFTLSFAGQADICARYIVNAAGLFSDRVSALFGDDSFTVHPRKGEYILYDRQASDFVKHVIFQTPSKLGKGVLVSPTVDGTAFIGPTAVDQESRTDTSVTQKSMDDLVRLAQRSIPQIPVRSAITQFAGLRAQPSTGDFILGISPKEPRLIQAAGICSPGLSSAPAIAVETVESLAEAGFALEKKEDFDPVRKHIPSLRTMNAEEKKAAIAGNPLYGKVICRCETVSEAEIVEAIRRKPGARTVDGVKLRTRAGMGRCQGGFCMPRVIDILARELGVPMETITKFGGGSYLIDHPLTRKEGEQK